MNFRARHDSAPSQGPEPPESPAPRGIIVADSAGNRPVKGTTGAPGRAARHDGGSLRPLGAEAGDRAQRGRRPGPEPELEINGGAPHLSKDSRTPGGTQPAQREVSPAARWFVASGPRAPATPARIPKAVPAAHGAGL